MSDSILSADGMSWGSMLGIAIAVIIIGIALFWFLRRRGHMTFMRGGTNRQPRLAVLDAAAVDARRRLVLVRRDNVEHLILIGGPSDVVVESGIHRTKSVQTDTVGQATARPSAGRAPARAQQPHPPAKAAAPETPTPPPATPETPAQPVPAQPTVAASASTAAMATSAASKPIEMEPLNLPKPDTPAPPARPVPHRPEVVTDKRAEAAARPLRSEQAAQPAQSRPTPHAGRPDNKTPDHATGAVSAAGTLATAASLAGSPKPAPVKELDDAKSDETDMATELESVLDAARDRVMTSSSEQENTAPMSKLPQDNPAVDQNIKDAPIGSIDSADAETQPTQSITADELIADFDKVLEAEINKAEERASEEMAAAKNEPASPDANEATHKDETASDDTADQTSKTASLEDEMKKLLVGLEEKSEK